MAPCQAMIRHMTLQENRQSNRNMSGWLRVHSAVQKVGLQLVATILAYIHTRAVTPAKQPCKRFHQFPLVPVCVAAQSYM